MRSSKIEWTQATWNPITGCSPVSKGCEHCYARPMAKRLQAMGQPHYTNGFTPTMHPDSLDLPTQWKQPQIIFVNSMSDLFHEDVPLDFIQQIFNTMHKANWHRFQILTKRSDRLIELSPFLEWTDNIWMGVTVESSEYLTRIDHLRSTSAMHRFLSCEPLLGPLGTLNLQAVDWVIVGGESGPGARPIAEEWVVEIRNQCNQADIPFFFKQWGGVNKKKAGRLLQGRAWDEVP